MVMLQGLFSITLVKEPRKNSLLTRLFTTDLADTFKFYTDKKNESTSRKMKKVVFQLNSKTKTYYSHV